MADYRKIEAAFQERGRQRVFGSRGKSDLFMHLFYEMFVDARIKRLTDDLSRMNNDMSLLKDEVSQILKLKDKKVNETLF
jgi:hypothetical protein